MSENQQAGKEQWMSLTDAAKELGISYYVLSRRVKKGQIKSKKSKFDSRVVLVDLVELRKIFEE